MYIQKLHHAVPSLVASIIGGNPPATSAIAMAAKISRAVRVLGNW